MPQSTTVLFEHVNGIAELLKVLSICVICFLTKVVEQPVGLVEGVGYITLILKFVHDPPYLLK